MREFSTPSTVAAPRAGNLTDDVVRNATQTPDAPALSRPDGAGGWADVTAATFRDEVVGVAAGLFAAGVGLGDRVALVSRTRYEWTLLDYAIWWVGAVSVPVYETTRGEALAWILRDSGCRAAVVETAEHLAAVAEVRGDLPDLRDVWSLDAAPEDGAATGAVALLTERGLDVDAVSLEARRRTTGPADDATLIYTSGTTGRPKGCRLTHGNFLTELAVTLEELHELFEGDDASTLLFLPLPHVFARVVQIGSIRAGVRLGHHAGVSGLATVLGDFAPTFVLAVPRVFENLFNQVSQQAVADGRGGAFDRAVEVAVAWSRALERGRPSVALRARRAVHDRLVYAGLRRLLGGRCTYAVSGGAPLGERLGHFYRGAGITVLEGYGLSETTAAVTVGSPEAHKVGTVGRPLPGTAVRIADDGEVLLRGPHVFSGYWHDPAADAEAFDADGWFRTGDLGSLDEDGFLSITGRKKEIIVTAGGKNVAPAVLEDRLRAHPIISQALVVGDARPYVAALLTLDADVLPGWLRARGMPVLDVAAAATDPGVRAVLQEAVDAANAAVSRAEQVKRFAVLTEDFTEANGLLTPSMKLRRRVVLRERADDVERLYAD